MLVLSKDWCHQCKVVKTCSQVGQRHAPMRMNEYLGIIEVQLRVRVKNETSPTQAQSFIACLDRGGKKESERE